MAAGGIPGLYFGAARDWRSEVWIELAKSVREPGYQQEVKAMRVMVIVKASKESEQGVLPDKKSLAEMGKYNAELVQAGIMLAAEGLHPSSKGVRIKFEAKAQTAIHGPFPETEDLASGFWLWQVESMEDAIHWLKRAPFGGGAEVEIRPLFEADDFGAHLTPELREQQVSLRKQMERQRAA